MNSVFALIISLAMLFTGSVPSASVPETMSARTVSDITVTVGDETYSPEAAFTLSCAVSSESADFSFSAADASGKVIMPAALQITPNALSFYIEDPADTYSVSADDIVSILGNAASEDSLAVASAVCDDLKPAVEFLASLNDSENMNRAMSDVLTAFIISCAASSTETTVTIDGTELNASEITLNVSPSAVMQMLDSLKDGENEGISAALNGILDLISIAAGTEVTSFSAILGEDASEGIPMTVTTAADEDAAITYQNWDLSLPIGDDRIFNFNETITGMNENVSVVLHMDLDTGIQMMNCDYDIEMVRTDSNKYDLAAVVDIAMTIADSWTVTEYGEDTEETVEAHLITTNVTGHMDITAAIEDQKYENMDMDYTFSVIEESDTDPVSDPFDMHVTASKVRVDSVEGTKAYDLNMSIDNVPEIGTLSFGARITDAEIPYVNAFEGESTAINAEVMENPSVLMRLASDAMSFAADFTSLVEANLPEGVTLDDLFSALPLQDSYVGPVVTEEEVSIYEEVPDVEETEAPSDEDSGEFYDTVEEALEHFAAEILPVNAPEGFELTSVYADSECLSLDYSAEDGRYISVYFFSGFAPSEDAENSYYENDDGTIFAADLIKDGIEADIYIPDMSREDADALFTEMGLL